MKERERDVRVSARALNQFPPREAQGGVKRSASKRVTK